MIIFVYYYNDGFILRFTAESMEEVDDTLRKFGYKKKRWWEFWKFQILKIDSTIS